MQLSKDIAEKIAAWVEASDIKRLQQASQQLTSQYQTRQQPISLQSLEHHLAYVVARMPATYSVCKTILNQIKTPQRKLKSMLDLGAGPGTASLAALDVFPQIDTLTLVDRDPLFQSLALELLPQKGFSIQYALEDVTRFAPQTSYDLVVCSYALNEVSQKNLETVITQAWGMTQQFLILVEPGTPLGFSILKGARQLLIEAGAYVIAPCTHQNQCPLKEGDWCHFPVHVERNRYHRLTKGADLPYEQEKYSYLIVARHPSPRPSHRIIKRPLQRPGHVIFDLCGESGVHRNTISKKSKDRYTQARKQAWGDGWSIQDD